MKINEKIKANEKVNAAIGGGLLVLFIVWTLLIKYVDARPVGQNGTTIGFSTVNVWFHKLTGANMTLYTVTDWLGLVPIVVCMGFALLGLIQWIKRKSIKKVDADILILGLYYILVIFGYLIFEMIPINYRPILINGVLEASYPSSTTLLVLSVMPTLVFQIGRRVSSSPIRLATVLFSVAFSAFMVIDRLVSGVHWLTDILGAVLLSAGLYFIYRSAVFAADRKRRENAENSNCQNENGEEK